MLRRSSVLPQAPQVRSSPTGVPQEEQLMRPSAAYSTASMPRIWVRDPTVERGLLWRMMLCWTAMVGARPVMLSKSCSSPSPARTPIDRRYCRRPSSKTMSNTRLDLPDPLTPVATMTLFLGRERSKPLRLLARAPRMVMVRIGHLKGTMQDSSALEVGGHGAFRRLTLARSGTYTDPSGFVRLRGFSRSRRTTRLLFASRRSPVGAVPLGAETSLRI